MAVRAFIAVGDLQAFTSASSESMRRKALLILYFSSACVLAWSHPVLIQTTLLALVTSASAADQNLAGQTQQVNLVLQEGQTTWKDPRGPLTRKARELGLSPEEVERIRNTTGYVICPGRVDAEIAVGTGVLAGNGSVVITVAHVFIDPKTNNRREPLSECVFVSLAEHHSVAKLDFSSDNSHKFYTSYPDPQFYNDRAIVRLKRRMAGAKLLPFDMEGRSVSSGDQLIMISADQERETVPPREYHFKMTLSDGGTYEAELNAEPIAQQCTAMSYYPQTSVASSIMYSDCNATKIASGSILLIRHGDGLVLKALHARGGKPSADYKSFKIGQGVADEELSFSLEVGLDPNVAKDILSIEGDN